MDIVKNGLVILDIEGHVYKVGEMVLNNRIVYFCSNVCFLKSGLNILTIRLPFNNEINSADKEPFMRFNGIFRLKSELPQQVVNYFEYKINPIL